MKTRTLALSVVALLSVHGCSQSESDPPLERPISPGAVHFGGLATSLSFMDLAMTGEAIQSVMGDASSWEDADRRVQDALLSLDPARRSAAEQLAAVALIRSSLTVAPMSDAKREAAARYARVLVRNNSPEAPLVLEAVEVAGSALTAAERKSLTTATVATAGSYLERQGADPTSAPAGLDTSGDRLRTALQQVVSEHGDASM